MLIFKLQHSLLSFIVIFMYSLLQMFNNNKIQQNECLLPCTNHVVSTFDRLYQDAETMNSGMIRSAVKVGLLCTVLSLIHL